MKLQWWKCKGGVWCSFRRLIIDEELRKFNGVYIIWTYSIDMRRVEYVGSGNIGLRILTHRNDEKFESVGYDALVSWALVPMEHERASIEAYLIHKLKPVIGIASRKTFYTRVNLPWEDL